MVEEHSFYTTNQSEFTSDLCLNNDIVIKEEKFRPKISLPIFKKNVKKPFKSIKYLMFPSLSHFNEIFGKNYSFFLINSLKSMELLDVWMQNHY